MFSKDVKDFNDKVSKASLNVFRGTALSILGNIVKRTPVLTGRLRGNWFSSINAPINQIDGSSEGYGMTVARAKLGDSIYMVNNLPYAKAIENGSSKQAPTGMVKVTIEEFADVVARNARKFKV